MNYKTLNYKPNKKFGDPNLKLEYMSLIKNSVEKTRQVFKRQKPRVLISRNNLPSYQAALEGNLTTGEKAVRARRMPTRKS